MERRSQFRRRVALRGSTKQERTIQSMMAETLGVLCILRTTSDQVCGGRDEDKGWIRSWQKDERGKKGGPVQSRRSSFPPSSRTIDSL